MADAKISALTALTGANVADDDLFVIVDTSTTTTKKITAAETRIAVGIPPGVIFPYAGTSAPTGFLFCYGQTVSQSTYAALYAVLGTTFGSDSGGNFTLPDLRGRAPFGKDNMGGSAANRVTNAISGITGTTLGSSGGDQRMSAHTHIERFSNNTGGTVPPYSSSGDGTVSASGIETSSTGDGSSENMPPALILNYIIKT